MPSSSVDGGGLALLSAVEAEDELQLVEVLRPPEDQIAAQPSSD